MIKFGFARQFGKGLASIVIGASTLVGASMAVAADLIPIGSVTNVSPFISSRSAHYVCSNVTFNGRVSKNIIVLLFKFHNSSDGYNYLVGGLTCHANSTNTSFNESYLYGNRTTFPPASNGLSMGQVATNGLNGTSEWFGGIDLNGNGFVGNYYDNLGTRTITFEPGEYISPDRISFVGMPAMPADKTSTVSIAIARIIGYECFASAETGQTPDIG